MVSKGTTFVTQKGVAHPLIVLADTPDVLESKRALSFGLAKAKLILAHFADIQRFVVAAEQFVAQRDAPQSYMQRPAAVVPGYAPVPPQPVFMPQPVVQPQPVAQPLPFTFQ